MRVDIDSRYAIPRHNGACLLNRLTWSDPEVARLTVLAIYQTHKEPIRDWIINTTRRAGLNNISALLAKVQRLAGLCQHAFERCTL